MPSTTRWGVSTNRTVPGQAVADLLDALRTAPSGADHRAAPTPMSEAGLGVIQRGDKALALADARHNPQPIA
jgi:hypothetical protein